MTVTGRISNSSPNYQEIPRNSPEAERLKAAFRGMFKVVEGPVNVTIERMYSYDKHEADSSKEAD